MINNLVPILEDRDVTIVPTAGYNSTPFMYESYMRLLHQAVMGKQVHILYFSDFTHRVKSLSTEEYNVLEHAKNYLNEIKDTPTTLL